MKTPNGQDGVRAGANDALAAVVAARRGQIGVRLGLCLVIALLFHSFTGALPAALWVAAYACLQTAERLLFGQVEAQSELGPTERIAFLAMVALSNCVFAFFGIMEARSPDVGGLICAVLLWSGAIVNGAMVSGESRAAFATAVAPSLLAFCSVPFFVVGDGGALTVGLAIVVAGLLNGAASAAMWDASRRQLASAASAREAARLALIDVEIGLPNRYWLQRRVAELKVAPGGGTVVVAAIGLDRFESLQAALGHTLTVDLVDAVASRLAPAFPGAVIARLATRVLGAVWIARDLEEARGAMLGLRQMMKEPIRLGETAIDASVTVGLSEATSAAPASEIQIVDRAIMTLERARNERQAVACFDADLVGAPVSELTLMSELQQALDGDAMGLHYQPICDLGAGRIVGAEALVRWRHPQRGPLAPDAFLPMAEETGRIAALTQWVLRRAVADQRRLMELGHALTFSVNLSGCLVDDEDFATTILEIAGQAVGKIILEVTETAIIGDPTLAYQTLWRFKAAGLGISIDDYGSGLSSLSYLKNIPADELKIDKIFMLNLTADRTDEMLVRAAIELAHSLGMKVVAEGIETEAALTLLASMGCDLGQGYFIARPMPFADLQRLLGERALEPA